MRGATVLLASATMVAAVGCVLSDDYVVGGEPAPDEVKDQDPDAGTPDAGEGGGGAGGATVTSGAGLLDAGPDAPPDGPVDPCANGAKDPGESAIDCGGVCPACDAGETCSTDADCVSLDCNDGFCKARCDDGVKDGLETGIDCGGPCNDCPEGEGCLEDDDCASEACGVELLCLSHCENAVKDADETDIDCGGLVCSPCGYGATCKVSADCVSGICEDGDCS